MRLNAIGENPPVSGIRYMFELADKYENVVKLCIGEPGFPTPDFIIQAGQEALEKGYTKYTSNAGIQMLREAIARKMDRENHIQADPQTEIIVTAGGVEAVLLAFLVTVDRGDDVLIPDPSWPNYPEQVQMACGNPVRIPTYEVDNFVPLAENIEKAITPRTRVLVLNSPNNPTGAVIPREEMMRIRDVVLKYNLTVISDEPYERLIYDGNEHISIASLPDMKEHVITVNTFSKTYAMSGWRVGYGVGPRKAIQAMVLLKEYTSSSVNAAAQYACAAALDRAESDIMRMVNGYQHNRDILIQGLNECKGIVCPVPKGAFYAFANVKGLGMTSQELAEDLVKEVQVVTTPGTAFGNCGEGYLRFSYASSEKDLREALHRLKQYCNR